MQTQYQPLKYVSPEEVKLNEIIETLARIEAKIRPTKYTKHKAKSDTKYTPLYKGFEALGVGKTIVTPHPVKNVRFNFYRRYPGQFTAYEDNGKTYVTRIKEPK